MGYNPLIFSGFTSGGSSGGGGGGVSSVALALPASVFTVSGSPVTTTGTLTGSFNTQSANTVFAGPSSGGASVPTFRSLVSADIPSLNYVSSVTASSPLFSSGGLTPNLTIQVANTSQNGYLSSTDWNTFNNKQSTLTFGSISTSTTGVSVGSGANSTVGPNVTINVQTASGSQPGLLSSADWTTFNNKQPAGSYLTALTGDVTASGPGSVAATNVAANDTIFKIYNNADNTKLFKWDLSAQSTGITNTLKPLSAQNQTYQIQPNVDATANIITQNTTSEQIFIGSNTTIGGSNSGIQYSNATTANRGQIKLHSYFNGTSIAGVSTLTSRSGTVGTNAAVVNGQDYSKWTAQAAATTPGSAPISGTFAFKANTVNSLTVTSDFHLQLTNLAGTLTDALYITSEGNLTATGTLAGTNFSGSSSGTNTGDQTITLTGDVTGSGTGSITASISATTVTGKLLTGFVAGPNSTVLATDSILQGLEKLQAQITAGGGTVTSVALADGSSTPIYTITGSPVTTSGTLTQTLNTQSANLVFAGPSSGGAAQPTFRSLVSGDIPSLSSIYLPLTGGTMSGVINMGSHKITSVTDPTSAQDAATKNYVDNALAGINPAVAVQAATTSASDTSGFTYNNGVSGIGASLTGPVNTSLTVDGYTFTALGQRLLVKNDTQSPSGAFNGVYYVTQLQTALLPLILTRALDYDMPSDINNTGAIPVINGTVNNTTQWVLTSLVNTVGTDPLTFTRFARNPSDYSLASAGDINETSFTAADNQSSAANITGFAFANATVRSFDATVSIVRNTTYAAYKLYGIQKGSSWEMSQNFTGDTTGITFSITNAGQIQYTSTSTGFTSLIKFRAITTTV